MAVCLLTAGLTNLSSRGGYPAMPEGDNCQGSLQVFSKLGTCSDTHNEFKIIKTHDEH